MKSFTIIRNFYLLIIVSSVFMACGTTSNSTSGNDGSSSGARNYKASITGSQYRDHTVSFRENQKLKITLDAGGATCYFNIITPSGETIFNGSNEGKDFAGTMSFTGSYKVRVYLMGASKSDNQKVSYTLWYNVL